jgi:cutinase
MLKSLFLAALFGLSASALPITTTTSSPTDLVVRQNFDVTRNDLVNGICAPITIIFARGTLELGNVGSLAGPPFFNALTDIVGSQNVAVQGVDYGATIAGYLEGGDPAGAATLASLVNLAVSQCPSTQIVLSGYRYGFPSMPGGSIYIC